MLGRKPPVEKCSGRIDIDDTKECKLSYRNIRILGSSNKPPFRVHVNKRPQLLADIGISRYISLRQKYIGSVTIGQIDSKIDFSSHFKLVVISNFNHISQNYND